MQRNDARTAAEAVARWFESRDPDDLGAILDGAWSLGRAAPEWCPDLATHAQRVLRLADPDVPADPRALAAFAELLEHMAERVRSAARLMPSPRFSPRP